MSAVWNPRRTFRSARRTARTAFRRYRNRAACAQHVPRGEASRSYAAAPGADTLPSVAADRGPRRAFEPFLVTLNDKSEVFPGSSIRDEFIYLLEGSLTYRHGDETHMLKAGDALTSPGRWRMDRGNC